MEDSPQHLKINVGGSELSITCAPSQRENLLQAVQLLNSEISNIQNSFQTSSITLETSAIIAALNFAAELIESQDAKIEYNVDRLIDEINATLTN